MKCADNTARFSQPAVIASYTSTFLITPDYGGPSTKVAVRMNNNEPYRHVQARHRIGNEMMFFFHFSYVHNRYKMFMTCILATP